MKTPFLILFLLYIIAVATYAYLKPSYNWDTIPYIAAAISFEQSDKKIIHDEAYGEINKNAPPEIIAELNRGNYRREMATNDEAFFQQLAFYKVKILYAGSLYILNKLGMSPFHATLIISILSSWLISCLLLVWLFRYLDGVFPFILSIILLSSAGISEIAGLSTPDAMSGATIGLALFLMFSEKRLLPANILLIVSILIRPDNISVALLMFIYQRFFTPDGFTIQGPLFIILCLCAIGTFLGASYGTGGYGWSMVFHHTFVEKIIYPAEYHGTFSTIEYVKVLAKGVGSALMKNPSIAFFVFLSVFSLMLNQSHDKTIVLYRHLTIIALLTIAIHVLLFPDLATRFFVIQYVVIGLSFIITIFSSMGRQRMVVRGSN